MLGAVAPGKAAGCGLPLEPVVDAIKFGASVSSSGRYALQGRQVLAGLRAWAGATNAKGGVAIPGGSLHVTLVHHDDASSSARAVANVERLIAVDRVQVLIGRPRRCCPTPTIDQTLRRLRRLKGLTHE